MGRLLAQLLIGASFAVASYQDVKDRAVHDFVWIPAVVGAALSLYLAYPDLVFPLAKIGLVAFIAVIFLFFGAVGEADGIALVLIAADPYRFSPIFPLFGGAVVALTHIGYEWAVGNARGTHTISLEKFLGEQRWIPHALVSGGVRTPVSVDVNEARDEVEAKGKPGMEVDVSYGVPTVAYLGVGYAAFLVFLMVFSPQTLLSLP